ncbi:MAG: EthD family reductase [Ktedonobacteraceae bacterium]
MAMFQLTVLYGHPENIEEFDHYYTEVHTPLVQKIQGLQGLSVTKFTTGPRGEQPPYYQMAALYANTRAEFDALMSTPEGKAVGRDVRNFATGGATMIYGDEQKYL